MTAPAADDLDLVIDYGTPTEGFALDFRSQSGVTWNGFRSVHVKNINLIDCCIAADRIRITNAVLNNCRIMAAVALDIGNRNDDRRSTPVIDRSTITTPLVSWNQRWHVGSGNHWTITTNGTYVHPDCPTRLSWRDDLCTGYPLPLHVHGGQCDRGYNFTATSYDGGNTWAFKAGCKRWPTITEAIAYYTSGHYPGESAWPSQGANYFRAIREILRDVYGYQEQPPTRTWA